MHNLLLKRLRRPAPYSIAAVLAAVLALAAVGCGGRASDFNQPIELLESPIALHDTLMFVDAAGNRAYLFDAAGAKPAATAKQVALPFSPQSAVRRLGTRAHDQEEALVLCDGRRSSATATEKPAALAAVGRDGSVREYDVGTTPFDTLVQSDDGRYAVLFRSGKDEGRLLNNANELVIIDLDEKPSSPTAISRKTPPSFGHTPSTAVFSPSMRIAGEDRRLLVVLSAAEVTLIDLNHLDLHRETVVQLGGPDSPNIDPEQVLFGDGEPTLYIRGKSSDDIFVFRLEAHDNPGGNDFRPSINQLGGGSGPSDMVLFGGPANLRLLVIAKASMQAIVVDPTSSKATPIGLPNLASHVLLFQASSPKDAESHTRALIYGESAQSLMFLDLDDVESRKGRNLEELKLSSPIASIIPLLTRGQIVLMQGNGVSLLDLAQRTVEPITSNTALSDALFDAEDERLWVGPSAQNRIGTLDLATGATDELLLDSTIDQLVPMFEIGKLVVVHPGPTGYLTLVDAAHPSRESSTSVRGFLVANVLDRGEP